MSGREHGHDPVPHHSAQVLAQPHADNSQISDPHTSDELEVVPGFERENLQGWIPQLASEADVRAVIEKAFDYRGDVTLTCKDGSAVTGYLFDRRVGTTLVNSVVRLILANSTARPAISYSEIAAIAFSGRDTAAGKSYEAWVKKYWEKRAKGETNISIEPEALE
ncbi:MAG: hypothetical protein ABSB87_01950 [Terriglobales bacterium]|jgi:hypothetical protein